MIKEITQTIVILSLGCLLAACPNSDVSNYPTTSANTLNAHKAIPSSLHRNVWSAMAADYSLNAENNNPLVDREVSWFLHKRSYIRELTENSEPYIYYVFQQTRKRNMPAEIALLPMIESNYNPFLFSRRGATGLWQMMPGTASGFGLKINWWYDGRRDIKASTDAALDYLAYLHNQFGDWLLAIAAYDSGEGTVETAIAHNKKLGKPTNFWALPLPYETKLYVPKLLALANILSNKHVYHLHIPMIANKPYFDTVKLTQQMDLTQIANFANTSVTTIRALNPGFRRWATVPHENYALLLPSAKVAEFQKNIKNSKKIEITWMHHKVAVGESLYTIARRYKTKVDVIAQVNNLHNSTLHINENLLVPVAYHHNNLKAVCHASPDIAEDRLPGPHRVMHVVAQNDNLWSIAARYHVKPSQIRYWNKLAYHADLKLNQHLIIWQKHRHHVSPFLAYNVKAGDNLITIAHHYDTHAKILKHINHLKSDTLHIGQKLSIPKHSPTKGRHYKVKINNQMVRHTVTAGETLSSIAHYYQVPSHNILAWNKLTNHNLQVGQQLHIYPNSIH